MSEKVTLLVNTGTPDAPDRASVARYLSQFLDDPHIMGMPDAVRSALVNKVIVPGRAGGSSARYQQLWDDHDGGSPLLQHGQRLADALSEALGHRVLQVMRYGNPGVDAVADQLAEDAEINVVPLFPQMSYSNYVSAAEHVVDGLRRRLPGAQLRLLDGYYAHPAFIDALAESVRPHLREDHDLIVASFHSIPVEHQVRGAREGMDYQQQCRTTAELMFEALDVPRHKRRVTYQSAIKPMPWIKPFLEKEWPVWFKQGHQRVLVTCPGFAVDCLETVYDIGDTLGDKFRAAGGTEWKLVPALNDQPHWVAALARIIESDLLKAV